MIGQETGEPFLSRSLGDIGPQANTEVVMANDAIFEG